MKRLLYRSLPILLLVLIGLSTSISLVRADPEEPDWHPFSFDFADSDYGVEFYPSAFGFTGDIGYYSAGYGLHANVDSGINYTGLQWHLDFEPYLGDASIRNMTLYMVGEGAFAADTVSYDFTHQITGGIEASDGFGHYHTLPGEWSGPLNLYVTNSEAGLHSDMMARAIQGEYFGLACLADQSCDDEPPALTKPIASADLHEQWGMFDYQYVQDNDTSIPEGDTISDFPNTVYAFSSTSEAKVSAVAPGMVVSVTPYTGADCSGAFVILLTLRRCRVFVPEYIAQEAGSIVFGIELVNLSTVVVQDAEDENITYTYWLADATVSVGQDVVAGCVLGKTIQLKNPTTFEFSGFDLGASGTLGSSGEAGVSVNAGISGTFRSLLVDAGVTTVVEKDSGEPVQLYPSLIDEPDYANCRAATQTNCTLENPTLQPNRNGITTDGWGVGQGTAIEGGGVHLLRGGVLQQSDVVIRPDIGYTLSVMARVTTPIDSFYPIVLQIGSLSNTVSITEGDYQLVSWAVSAREVSVTNISVSNSLDTSTNAEIPPEVDILKVCLSPDTANVAPGACFFPDHSFDANGQGWTTTGDVSFRAGQAFMGDSSILSFENADLLTNDDDSPATYHLKALVRLNATSSFTGQEDKSVELKYGYPSEDGYSTLGVIDSALVESEGHNTYDGNVNIEHVYTLTQDVVISEDTEGTFSFGVLITDTDGYIKGLRIDSLCITPDTPDGSFPGQPGPFVPPFIEQCGVVPVPVDNNISSWTYYHWSNLNRFFNCTLMVKLNAMFTLMNDAWKTTRLFMRWLVVGTNRFGDWITSFVWWLGGHFRNMAMGQVTTVYQSGGSCNDLFCVLNTLITGILTPINNIVNTLLGLLNTAANLFLTVLTGIIGLALAFLGKLFALFNQVTGLFTGIIGAYSSATPATIAGLPTCSIDPTSSPFCRAVWVLDNTILGGRWAVLLTLILGIASIHLILWVIGEFRSAIITTGSSS